MPKYILIAGVNGAGKSTLYYLLTNLRDMPRINVDEIVREFGDWKNPSDVMKAGKIAVKYLQQLLTERRSFNQETTLCGKSIINNIRRAKYLGYQIEIHYVGVDSVEIAKSRVKTRVKNGGHGIPDEDIERRYVESFSNLKYIMPDCTTIFFYDNTKSFNRFAVYKSNEGMRIYPDVPRWFQMVTN
ncbi:MAG: ATPase [Lachnospiraceae bacterium]|nr:ATPase [Lachnospiraceae bacterium]